jgi:DNA-binding MarR family transcriptional regulator
MSDERVPDAGAAAGWGGGAAQNAAAGQGGAMGHGAAAEQDVATAQGAAAGQGGEAAQGAATGQGAAAGPGGEARPGGEAGRDRETGGEWELPWAEPFVTDGERAERAELAAAFGAGVRRTGALMQLMGQAAADRIGINATDLNCLNILSFSGRMTAGELARATGLTTASITGVIDRLEEAGYVTRERDPHDRRRVVVQVVLEKALKDVASVFRPMIRDWQEVAAHYSDDELRLIVDFYGRMEEVFRHHLGRLRGGPEPTEP